MTTATPDQLDTATIARQLGYSAATVAQLCREGLIPARQSGRRQPWSTTRAELDRWRNERLRQTAAVVRRCPAPERG